MNRLLTYLDKRIFSDAFRHIIDQKILEPEEVPADIVNLELYVIEHYYQEVNQKFHQIENAKKQVLYRTNALITLVILATALIINNLIPDEVKVTFLGLETSASYLIGLFISAAIIFVVAFQNFHPATGIAITGYPDNSHIKALIDNSKADKAKRFQKKQVLIQAINTYRAANSENAKLLLGAGKFLAAQITLSGLLIFSLIHFAVT